MLHPNYIRPPGKQPPNISLSLFHRQGTSREENHLGEICSTLDSKHVPLLSKYVTVTVQLQTISTIAEHRRTCIALCLKGNYINLSYNDFHHHNHNLIHSWRCTIVFPLCPFIPFMFMNSIR
ncbi:hypothetical protein BLOT_006506 [Blomia tropicalis]|nr:hypothetical protein BLOT_006506 [Blomia tropicalis]